MTDAPTKEKVIDPAGARAEASKLPGEAKQFVGSAGHSAGQSGNPTTATAEDSVHGAESFGKPSTGPKPVSDKSEPKIESKTAAKTGTTGTAPTAASTGTAGPTSTSGTAGPTGAATSGTATGTATGTGEVSESKADPEDFVHTSKSLKNPPPDQDKAVQERAKEVATQAEKISPDPLKQFKFPGALNPTLLMVARSNTWNKLLRSLVAYFKEVARVMDETAKLQDAAARAIDIPFLEGASARVAAPTPHPGNYLRNASAEFKENEDLMFAPYGNESVSDIPVTLLKLHKDAAKTAAQASPLITRDLIPRLEQIRRDLTQATADFTKMGSNFKDAAAITGQQKATEKEIQNYETAIDSVLAGHTPSTDPYVLKLGVDHQLQRQVAAENHLLDSYRYVEDAAKAVDKGVMTELQEVIKEYTNALGVYGDIYVNAAAQLVEGVVSKSPLYELDSFTTREPHVFVNADVPPRSIEAAEYKHKNSNLARAVLKGDLERRTKYLKSFVKAEYILTPQTLIELKNGQPEVGIDLSDATIDTDHKHHGGDRFVLNARQVNSSSGKAHTWVFRSDKAKDWVSALQKITGAKSASARADALFGGLESVPAAAAAGTAAAGTAGTAGTGAPTTGAPTTGTSKAASGPGAGAGAGAAAGAGPSERATGLGATVGESAPPTGSKDVSSGAPGAAGASGAGAGAAGIAGGLPSDVKGVNTAQKSAVPHGVGAKGADAVAPATREAPAAPAAAGAAGVAGVAGTSGKNLDSHPADKSRHEQPHGTSGAGAAAIGAGAGAGAGAAAGKSLDPKDEQLVPSNPKDEQLIVADPADEQLVVAENEQLVEGAPTQSRERRPSNYKKDEAGRPLSLSTGASAGGEHGLEGVDVSTGAPQPLSYRKDADKSASGPSSAGPSSAGLGTTDNDSDMSDISENAGYRKLSVDPALAADSNVQLAANVDQSMAGIANKDLGIWDEINGFGSKQGDAPRTLDPADRSGETQSKGVSSGAGSSAGYGENPINRPADKAPGLSTSGETGPAQTGPAQTKSAKSGVSPDASGAGPGVDTYHEQQGELAHATDKVPGLNKVHYTPVTDAAPTEAGVAASELGEFNLKGNQISHPVDKVPGLDTLGERPTGQSKGVNTGASSSSGPAPTEAGVVASEVGEFNLKGNQISHPVDKVPGLDTLGERPTGHAVGSETSKAPTGSATGAASGSSAPTEAAVVAGEVGEFNLKGDQISHPIDKVPGLDTLGERPAGHALGPDDGAQAVKSDIGNLRSHLGSSTDALTASKGSAIDDDADDDNASVFSYDRKHRASTYTGDDYHEDNTLPPAIERRLTQTSHKFEDPAADSGIGAARTASEANDTTEKVLERRKSTLSLHSTGRKNSRRATASYGGDDLKPLTATEPGKLFFADDLPATTSGK